MGGVREVFGDCYGAGGVDGGGGDPGGGGALVLMVVGAVKMLHSLSLRAEHRKI